MNEAELPEAPVGSATPADVPGQLVPDQAVPGQVGPGQAVPGQLGPGQAVPDRAVPGQAVHARAAVGPGREIAFTDFYRATTPSLIAFLVWQGARLADAADVAQETMATAYRRWHDLDNPRAWAFRVASRALIRRLTSTREEPFAEPPEPSPLVRATAIEHWEQHHDITRAVTRLPPRQRQVMAWTLAGSTPAEIAAELGLKAETVRSTLLKARRALAKELHGAGGGQ